MASGESFDPIYYSTVDEIYHSEWILDALLRQELLRRSVRRLWPEGHPTRLIQVAGTAGKGSTCRFLEAGLRLVGRAGAFCTPEMFDFRERFTIAGTPVTRAEVTRAWETRVRPLCLELALEDRRYVHVPHEINILLALCLFEEHRLEWAAVETSVGGRYDQTSALEVVATVLTNVGSDHEVELGDQAWQRALEKVGIARPGIPFFSSETSPELRAVLSGVCSHVGAPCRFIEPSHVDALEALRGEASSSLLAADHQRWNAALALAVLAHLQPDLDPARIVERLEKVQIPGRFWRIEKGLYADIAHNPDKVKTVAAEVMRRFDGRDKLFVVGVTQTRSAQAVLAPLLPLARLLVITRATYEGMDPKKVQAEVDALRTGVPSLVVPEPARAVEMARSMRRGDEVIVVTGDMDLIDEALNPDPYLRTLNAHIGWRDRIPY